MLGVVDNPIARRPTTDAAGGRRDGRGRHLPPDAGRRLLRRPGRRRRATEVADPFFGGDGPDRNPCRNCGECMTGCRHDAKNTLNKNYLYLAEQAGAGPAADHGDAASRPRTGGGYAVHVRHTKAKLRRGVGDPRAHRRPGRARRLGPGHPEPAAPDEGRGPAAAPLRPARRPDPHQLRGDPRRHRARTAVDFTRGVAITSSFHPDEHTHIEPVRYGKGSNAMG